MLFSRAKVGKNAKLAYRKGKKIDIKNTVPLRKIKVISIKLSNPRKHQ